MKFTIDKAPLVAVLSRTSGVVERSTTLPILSHLMLEASDDGLIVTATDMEINVRSAAQATVIQPGRIAVPARKLFDIARQLPDDAEVTLTLKDERLALTSGRSRFVLSTLPAEEFPSPDAVGSTATFSVPATTLLSLIERVSFAQAKNDVRHYLNGALLVLREDGLLRFVATDGHRLALAEGSCDAATSAEAILPRKGISEISRLLRGASDDVRVSVGSGACSIEAGETRLITKLIDGTFPDYEAVVPQLNGQAIKVNRSELLSALNRVEVVSDEKTKAVRITLVKGALKLETRSGVDDGVDEIPVETEQASLTTGFSASYLTDAANAFFGENLRIQAPDGNTACLITDPDADTPSTKQVVMPLKV